MIMNFVDHPAQICRDQIMYFLYQPLQKVNWLDHLTSNYRELILDNELSWPTNVTVITDTPKNDTLIRK